jgi:N-hydroxyarylamine O-acetyltransferase
MISMVPATGWVDDYLARTGATRPAAADLQALRDLQLAHLLAVPFENLGEPIVLARAALVTKVTRTHRGGFGYELNGA